MTLRLFLLGLFCLILAYQVRLGIDTHILSGSFDFDLRYVPPPFHFGGNGNVPAFDEECLTSTIDWAEQSRLSSADNRLLMVNGRPAEGLSMYLREFREWQAPIRHPENPLTIHKPFFVVTQGKNGELTKRQLSIANCTCGGRSDLEATMLWLAAPIYCVALGFLAVLLRPLNPYAWAALLLFLSLSQVPFRFGPTPGFQWIGSPMLWQDWSRIPGLCYHWFASYAWPAPLTMALAWWLRENRTAFAISVALSALIFLFALVKVWFALVWSEGYEAFLLPKILQLMQDYETTQLLLVLLLVCLLGWSIRPSLGKIYALFAVVSVAAIYTPYTAYGEFHPSFDPKENYHRDLFPSSVYIDPEFVGCIFAAACASILVWHFRRNLTRQEWLCLLWNLPLLCELGGWFLGIPHLINFLDLAQYLRLLNIGFYLLGLGLFCYCVLHRTKPTPAYSAAGSIQNASQ